MEGMDVFILLTFVIVNCIVMLDMLGRLDFKMDGIAEFRERAPYLRWGFHIGEIMGAFYGVFFTRHSSLWFFELGLIADFALIGGAFGAGLGIATFYVRRCARL